MKFAVLPLALVLAATACAPAKPPAVAALAPVGPSPSARLADADALLRAGCLDCLLEAFHIYDALRPVPAVAGRAASGVIRAAGLVALRERSLGMSDSGHLPRARALLTAGSDLESAFAFLLQIIDGTAARIGRLFSRRGAGEGSRLLPRRQDRLRWMELLRATADDDVLSATVWVSFACENSRSLGVSWRDALLAPLSMQKDAPVVLFEVATCSTLDADALQAVVDRESRFREADYWMGFRELGRRRLDESQALLTRAYEWHPQWPAAALALAGLSTTAEEFAPALELYDRALVLLPGLADAMVGRVRALSYLGRYADAVDGANGLLETMPADGYFWRAWNKNQLEQIDEAWSDVRHAERLWVNSEVAKLAGVIAYRRRELDVARDRFETAGLLNASDCESHFYLGGVRAELRSWTPSEEAYLLAESCLERSRMRLVEEVAAIQTSNAPEDRKARRVASRQQKIATADSMIRQSWFNLAVAYYNLQRPAEARHYAELVVDDEQFGERARTILSDMRPQG